MGDLTEFEAMLDDILENTEAVDVHTHLFPPSHGSLMLWGIDALLTYHYCIAEFFTVVGADRITPEKFFQLSKREQADLVWEELFLNRSPVSEACVGILTTLKLLGLEELIKTRDLSKIREWYEAQDPTEFCRKVFRLAKVKFCVMTNIPFEANETTQWSRNEAKDYSDLFKAAVRVDPILQGNWTLLASHVEAHGLEPTIPNARQYLLDWAHKIDAVYFMASTPNGFSYNHHLMETYTDMDDLETKNDKDRSTELIDKVLIPATRMLESKAIALKLGACRGMNPRLNPCGGGDGVEVVDLEFLPKLCARYPDVKFLVTVLSRSNQHSLCVIANKFSNLHVYGCWWYCNNPSIIRETSLQRMEILGTGFTFQHSDARVLDQLLYKWHHSRRVIKQVLLEKYSDLLATGWTPNETEIQRDVSRLFGRSYEEFMAKHVQ